MSKIEWEQNCKDAMWSMFAMQMQNGGSVDVEATIESLKHHVAQLVRMTTQKTAGQRGKKQDISFDNLPRIQGIIICEAAALALSGYLGEMPMLVDNEQEE